MKNHRKKKTIIHVNQHRIKENRKSLTADGVREIGKFTAPVLTVKTYKDNRYGYEAVILGQDGKPAAVVVYSPNKPLACGAECWIETLNEVIVDGTANGIEQPGFCTEHVRDNLKNSKKGGEASLTRSYQVIREHQDD